MSVVALVSLLAVTWSAGVPPAAATTEVALAVEGARVAGDGGQVALDLVVSNPGPAFSGWAETRGAGYRTLTTVDVTQDEGRLRLWVSPATADGSVSVRLLDASERPVSAWREAPLDYGASVLVVGDRGADYAFLAAVLGMRVERSPTFPDDPREYRLHAAVVVASPAAAPLAAEARALREWVGRGGLLVWTVGPESSGEGWAAPRGLDLPAQPGERMVLGETSPILVSVQGSEPAPLTRPGLDGGTEVVSLSPTVQEPHLVYSLAGGDLIAVAVREGAGRKVMAGLVPTGRSAVDAADVGLVTYWQSLLAGAGPPPLGVTSSEGAAPHGFVTGRVPSSWLTVGSTVVYIVVVGVGLFVWLRRLRRRDAVWWVLPLVVVVCTVGVLGAGLALRGPRAVVVTRSNLIGTADGAALVAYRAVGIYAPWGAEVTVPLPAGAFAGPPVTVGVPGFEGSYTVRQRGDDVTFEDVRVAPGSGRTVVYGSLPDVSGGADPMTGGASGRGGFAWPWRLSYREEGRGASWTITNISDIALRHVTVLADGLWSLPDLPPGGGARFAVVDGRVTGGDAVRMLEPPRPADGDDLVEWDASRRLRDDWRGWGGSGGPAPALVSPASSDAGWMMPTVMDPTEIRVLAWSEEVGPKQVVSGLPSGAEVEGIVVYEAVLR